LLVRLPFFSFREQSFLQDWLPFPQNQNNMTQLSTAPLRQEERIQLIDTIRGVALLGILLMNIPYFSNPYQYAFNLDVLNERSGPNYYTWWAVNGVFEGTMRGLFSLLFGAGCLLLLTRLEKKNLTVTPADIYYRRLLWLLLFGLFNAFVLLWPGDILYSYAICGLFLYPFRRSTPKVLLVLGLFLLLFATLQSAYGLYEAREKRREGEKAVAIEARGGKLNEEQKEAKEAWVKMQEEQKPETIRKAGEKEIQAIGRQGYIGVFLHYLPVNVKLESSEFYGGMFFDCLGLFLIGMALFKWGILTGKARRRTYWLLMIGGYGAGLAYQYFYLRTELRLRFDESLLLDAMGPNLYEFRRTAVAIGHLSLITLLYRSGLLKTLWRWLAVVGQMAFTNYLMQSIICTLLFYGYGFGLFGRLQRYETYYVVGAVWAFQILFSNLWLRYFRFGPFEWAWRSLTYWSRQPLLRSRQNGQPPAATPASEEKAAALA
jgi:uncharacterized protein